MSQIRFLMLGLVCSIAAALAIIFIWLAPGTFTAPIPDTFIVGVSADFPPFSFMQDDQLVGLDIDLMHAVGKKLNKQVTFVEMPFATLLPSLQLGNIHIVASGITATSERAKRVLFCPPYLERDKLIIVSLAALPLDTIEQLTDQDVVVNQGYTADLYLSAIKGPRIMRIAMPAQAFLALATGRVVAFVTAYSGVKPFFDQYEGTSFHVAEIPGTDENAALAVAPGHYALRNSLTYALHQLELDGTLNLLRTRWGVAR